MRNRMQKYFITVIEMRILVRFLHYLSYNHILR
nr:MAG TPA: hypothetical protein [Caudoviricetes sp.]